MVTADKLYFVCLSEGGGSGNTQNFLTQSMHDGSFILDSIKHRPILRLGGRGC